MVQRIAMVGLLCAGVGTGCEGGCRSSLGEDPPPPRPIVDFPDARTSEGRIVLGQLRTVDLRPCMRFLTQLEELAGETGGQDRLGAGTPPPLTDAGRDLYTLVDVRVGSDGAVEVLRVAGGTLVIKTWESCLIRRLKGHFVRPPPSRSLTLRVTLVPPSDPRSPSNPPGSSPADLPLSPEKVAPPTP